MPRERPENKTTEPIRILVIAGPTAVGKSEFALHAAQRYDGEIVSCDSMQLYRYMDIGSAKPTPEERALVPHHLVDCIDPLAPDGDFTAAKYAALAREAIEDIHSRGRLPIVCGGTGLYLNAILYDMDFGGSAADPALREELETLAQREGSEALHRMLFEKDPAAAQRIHPNNTKKIIRALERLAGGEGTVLPFQEVRKKNPLYDPLQLCLTRDRAELYERINARVLKMIEAGLVDEVRGLQERGLSDQHIAMLGIGYKEILPFLCGETTLDEAIEKIQKNTRHLAKRQLTWFRRYDTMFWLNLSEYQQPGEALEAMFEWVDQNL